MSTQVDVMLMCSGMHQLQSWCVPEHTKWCVPERTSCSKKIGKASVGAFRNAPTGAFPNAPTFLGEPPGSECTISVEASGYSLVRGGSCKTIETKEECETAARVIGLNDTAADTPSPTTEGARPPGCYFKPLGDEYWSRQLYFNPLLNSSAPCSDKRLCVCDQKSTLSMRNHIHK